jgi:Na+-transporting methylmalonyl-CoA/oxaloacetate decarboxylase gamma subunit
VPALSAFDSTFGLLVTFGGIGIVVNVLIVYIVVQTIGERSANRRSVERGGKDTTSF